jgi:hypothetical protein
MRTLLFLFLTACSTGPESASTPSPVQPASAEAPDLGLLLVAGLRSDTAASGGGAQAFLDAMPSPRVHLEQLYTQSSAPFSSVASMLTGRYPGAIPICNRLLSGEHEKTEAQQAWCARIPPEVHTLPSVLGVYGYRSLLVSADFPGASALAVGFDAHLEVDSWTDVQSSVDSWWSADPGRPRFVVVLLGDGAKTVLGRSSLQRFPEHRLQWLETVTPNVAKVELDSEQVAADYRAGAAEAGRVLSGVLKTVRGGTSRPSWALVGSTSGMSLDERTGFGDAPVPLLTDNILLDRTLRVPLLMYGSPLEQQTVSTPAQAVDILPTLVELAGGVAPAGTVGQSLRQLSTLSGEAYSEFGDMISLRRGQHLLVFRCSLHNSTALDPTVTEQLKAPLSTVPAGHYALYNVVEDPLQQHNLRASQPQRVSAMRERMVSIRTGLAAPPTGTLTPQRLWALRMAPSEGYW